MYDQSQSPVTPQAYMCEIVFECFIKTQPSTYQTQLHSYKCMGMT